MTPHEEKRALELLERLAKAVEQLPGFLAIIFIALAFLAAGTCGMRR